MVIVPGVDVSIPPIYNRPKSVVRSEFLCDYSKALVVSLISSEEDLSRVEFSRLLIQMGKSRHRFRAEFHYFLVLGDCIIRMEVFDDFLGRFKSLAILLLFL